MYIIAGTLLCVKSCYAYCGRIKQGFAFSSYMLCAVADVIGVIVLAVTGFKDFVN